MCLNMVMHGEQGGLGEKLFGSLNREEKRELAESFTELGNIFLRHVEPKKRSGVVKNLTADFSKEGLFNRLPPGNAGYGEHYWMEKFVPRGLVPAYVVMDIMDKSITWHEALHWLEIHKHLPLNYALTYATTRMLRLKEKPDGLVESDQNYGDIIPRFGNRQAWFSLVKENNTDEGLKSGMRILENWESAYYIAHEKKIDRFFSGYGETTESGFGPLASPYDTMARVGINRGLRAFAVGHFSGNIDHGWTILWLHSQGVPFKKAELIVVTSIERGDTDKFYTTNYNELTKLLSYYLQKDSKVTRILS